MTDWNSATERLIFIFKKRVKAIRSDIPSSEIAEEAGRTLLDGIPDESGSLKMDGSGLMSLINRINRGHKERIIGLAREIGTVLDDNDTGQGAFAGENEDSILIRTDGLLVKVGKETALKILTLGEIP